MAPTLHLDSIEAGKQITRGDFHWGEILGAPTGPITFGFRSSPPDYNSAHGEQTSFTKFSADQMAAAKAALRTWANVANISFIETNPGGYTDDATILFANYAHRSDGAAGFAFMPTSNAQGPLRPEGDVWINRASTSDPNVEFETFLHEIGHALGLSHPGNYGLGASYNVDAVYVEDSNQYSVMSYFEASETGANHLGGTLRPSTPLLHDIAAIQRLYGANTEFNTSDTVYGFNSNADPAFRISSASQDVVFCIWDGGGNDTLDLSGYGDFSIYGGMLIDLREGHFSNAGPFITGNISIAVGATIENAVGGVGDDTIVGNDSANHLYGDKGRDSFTAGLGDDVIVGGQGVDRAIFKGNRSEYVIERNGDSLSIVGPDGRDVLVDVESLQFDDLLLQAKWHDDAYVVLRGRSLSISSDAGLVFNDENVGPPSIDGGLFNRGTLNLRDDGSFDYTPPSATFSGRDGFSYGVKSSDGSIDGGADVTIYVVPVAVGASTTLDLLALGAREQIAATYAAFFGRAADAGGFTFWVGEFDRLLPIQGPAALFANIASSFGISAEAKALYPFLADPFKASDGQIGTFLSTVYDNLFNRTPDQGGLGYWTDQIKTTLRAGQFVGSVLVNILSGAQDTPNGKDITTLMSKVAVSLQYVNEQANHRTTWAGASDIEAATNLLDDVTADPQTLVVGIRNAEELIAAHG